MFTYLFQLLSLRLYLWCECGWLVCYGTKAFLLNENRSNTVSNISSMPSAICHLITGCFDTLQPSVSCIMAKNVSCQLFFPQETSMCKCQPRTGTWVYFVRTENVQHAGGTVCFRSSDVLPKGTAGQEILVTKHSISSTLHMIILQWDHLLFTAISLGNQITCKASFINRTLSRWAIAQGKPENKFIYIISSFRAEIVFSFYMYGNCQNQKEVGNGAITQNYLGKHRRYSVFL